MNRKDRDELSKDWRIYLGTYPPRSATEVEKLEQSEEFLVFGEVSEEHRPANPIYERAQFREMGDSHQVARVFHHHDYSCR